MTRERIEKFLSPVAGEFRDAIELEVKDLLAGLERTGRAKAQAVGAEVVDYLKQYAGDKLTSDQLLDLLEDKRDILLSDANVLAAEGQARLRLLALKLTEIGLKVAVGGLAVI